MALKTRKHFILGFIFVSLFSVVCGVFSLSSQYFPLKLPAANPFLVANQNSTLALVDNTLPNESEVSAAPPNKLAELDEKIKSLDIPIDGLSLKDQATHEIRIDFKPDTTESQKVQAQAIVDTFNWAPTPEELFNPAQAKEELLQKLSADKLAELSSQLSIINYFIDHKNFEKLEALMDSFLEKNIITSEDYMNVIIVLTDQNIPVIINAAVPPELIPAVEPIVLPPIDIIQHTTPSEGEVLTPEVPAPPVEIPPVIEETPTTPSLPDAGMAKISAPKPALFDISVEPLQTKNSIINSIEALIRTILQEITDFML